MIKVFITGASGFIGSYLVKGLIKKGFQVKALVRNHHQKEGLEKFGAEVVVGNFDKSFLKKQLSGCRFVYHLAASRDTSLSKKEYYEANVLPTKNLLAVATGQVQRFIFISTAHVHGFPKQLPISEETPYAPNTLYAQSKVEAEKEVMNFSSQLDYTIVRPVLVYGGGDRQQMMVKIAQRFSRTVVFYVGNGKNRMHFIFIDDLVEGLILMMNPQAKNQVFILAGENPITINNLLILIKKTLKIKKNIVYIPSLFLQPFIYLSRLISFINKKEPLITRQRINILSKDRFYSSQKAQDMLEFNPKINYQEGLRRTFGWYKGL